MNTVVLYDKTKNDLQIAINSGDTMSIVQFGRELNDSVRNSSEQVMNIIESSSSDNDIVKNLEKVMKKIDTNEIVKLNQNAKGIKKFIANISGKTNQLVNKYTNIASEMRSSYATIKQWENELETVNNVLNTIKKDCLDTVEGLNTHIDVAKEQLKDMIKSEGQTMVDIEKQSILRQKISDFEMQKAVAEQAIENTDIMKKTNYQIYRKMFSAYDSVLPVIQQQISLQAITSKHQKKIDDLNYLDQLRDKLLVDGAKNLVDVSMKSIEMLQGNENAVAVIQEAKNIIKQGKAQLDNIEKLKLDSLKLILLEENNEN